MDYLTEIISLVIGFIMGYGFKFVIDRSRKDQSESSTVQQGNIAGGDIAGRDISKGNKGPDR